MLTNLIPILLAANSTIIAPAQPTSRAEEYERAVAAKQAVAKPEQKEGGERLFDTLSETVLEPLFGSPEGVSIKVGGLYPGSGFAAGPRFRHRFANDSVRFETSLVGSFRRYYAAEARLSMTRIAGSRFDFDLGARHSDSPSISYFGPGSDSQRSGRTSFRREDTEATAGLRWRPTRRYWSVGYEITALKLNIGPGKDTLYPSIEERYTPRQAPGIDFQSSYLVGGPFVQFDSRDRAGLPVRGGRYAAQLLQHWDRSYDRYSFNRVRFTAERYFPFLNDKRVIALRARTDLSYASSNNTVPFYMQPTLGGPDDVRGFDRFRFHGNNATVMNAEYRWEVAPTLDMALFADAGNVFDRPGLIGFRDVKTAAGLGVRVKTRDAVVMRLDAGASREGVRVWIAFSNIF